MKVTVIGLIVGILLLSGSFVMAQRAKKTIVVLVNSINLAH